jgi:TRAP-type C4-dicarboxylate transport system substrate-binding protein
MKFARIATLLAAMAVAAPALAQQPVTLKFAAGTPGNSDMWRLGLMPIIDKIVAASEGTLKIDTFPDGTLSTDGVTYDRVLAGVADMGWDLPLVYGARFQSIGVIGLPFKYDDAGTAGAAMWRMYEKGVFGNEV